MLVARAVHAQGGHVGKRIADGLGGIHGAGPFCVLWGRAVVRPAQCGWSITTFAHHYHDRWQRILLLCILLAMAAWLVWQWPHSPWRAVLGALVPLCLYLKAMAVEFVLMHVTNRSPRCDARLSKGQVLVAERGGAVMCFLLAPAVSPAAQARLAACRRGKRGVVLVHGFICNRGSRRLCSCRRGACLCGGESGCAEA